MKKWLCLVLAAMLLLGTTTALAETKTVNPQENRGIQLQTVGLNEVEEGISPVTGRTLSELYVPEGFTGQAVTGRYLPMMVQVGNDQGGIGHRAPWGLDYVDLVYEFMLHINGSTRMTFLYNDVVPDSVGFVRSARVAQVWLREEWGAAFMFHGQQTYDGSNVVEEFKKLGHDYIYDPLLFNGWAGGKAWNKYFTTRAGLASPYHKNVVPTGIYSLVPEDYVAPNHTFKFTDEIPEGEPAQHVIVRWRDGESGYTYGSNLLYDVDANAYFRYICYPRDVLHPYVDYDTGAQAAFANVIVQYTHTYFNNQRNDAPVQEVIGEGNADFFMCGKRIAGYWKREDVNSRTVYYGPDGQEISLQRGKTLIILFPNNDEFGSSLSYSDVLP